MFFSFKIQRGEKKGFNTRFIFLNFLNNIMNNEHVSLSPFHEDPKYTLLLWHSSPVCL